MSWAHATQHLRQADDEALQEMHDAAARLLEYERQIKPSVVTELCLIVEETRAEARRRASPEPARSAG